MPEEAHFQRVRPLIAGVARRGLMAHVFTHRRFEDAVGRAGGRFVDLFGQRPLEQADDESLPVPCRYVTFAGHYAEGIIQDLAALRPALVIYDGFALVGLVVARALDLPSVHVCSGHDIDAAQFRAALEHDPRVRISPRCFRAVETLRQRHGISDASPFSYVADPSPFLNIYGEPSEYLPETGRRRLEPVGFFGSLPPIEDLRGSDTGPTEKTSVFGKPEPGPPDGTSPFTGVKARLKLYVSFGTVVWRYWAREALDVLTAVAQAVAAMPDVHALLSFGGAAVSPGAIAALTAPNVSVATYVDQWFALSQAGAFLTQHGLCSTHEAIFHRVPMISYPFFWDQPSLAGKCQALGLAIPLVPSLVSEPRCPVRAEDVAAALGELARRREVMGEKLDEARRWEWRTVLGREEVIDRIVNLCR